MKAYKLTIAYDGSDYSGWQAQDHKPSIAAALNHAFKKVFKTEIKILGASFGASVLIRRSLGEGGCRRQTRS